MCPQFITDITMSQFTEEVLYIVVNRAAETKRDRKMGELTDDRMNKAQRVTLVFPGGVIFMIYIRIYDITFILLG